MQTKKLPIVSTKKTIGETIKIITKGSLGVAVITKAGYKVAGYVTDGQIRKSKFFLSLNFIATIFLRSQLRSLILLQCLFCNIFYCFKL